MSSLPAFLAGASPDARGRMAAEIIAGTDDNLEWQHDWVQWLFPLVTPSAAVPGSPVLTREDVAAIRSDPRALETLRQATERMIAFYQRNDHWLSPHDHNHLRITRIVTSLRLLVGEEAAQRFLAFVMQRNDAAGRPVNERSVRFWQDAAVNRETGCS